MRQYAFLSRILEGISVGTGQLVGFFSTLLVYRLDNGKDTE